MADEPAFLTRIAESPQDPTVRLVYADWLEERGDPRCELVRADVEVRSLSVLDPRYRELKRRRQRLKAGCSDEWLDAIGCGPTHRPLFSRLPDSVGERWRLADEFTDRWHGPAATGLGYPVEELNAAEARIGAPLPAAVREWYLYFGRSSAWSGQDMYASPDQLRFVDEVRLNLRYENQGCTSWYIRRTDLAQPDPPVYGGDADRQVSPTFSGFALFTLLYETKFRGIWCEIEPVPEVIGPLTAGLAHADLPCWYWFPDPVEFWEGEDLIVEQLSPEYWSAAARTEAAYDELIRRTGGRVTRHD